MTRGLPVRGMALFVVLGGCAGELKDPERYALGIPCEDPAVFVQETCGECHTPGNVLGTVDLMSEGVGARLIDQLPIDCEGELLIDSTDPARSLILNKLHPDPVCGEQMPYRSPALSPRGIACVTAFVDDLLEDVTCADPERFVRNTCGIDGCHVAGNLLGIVDLVGPDLSTRLIGEAPLMCADNLLINADNPGQSLLLDKLNTSPTCGAQMPYGAAPLTAREVACVSAFVDKVLSDAAQ